VAAKLTVLDREPRREIGMSGPGGEDGGARWRVLWIVLENPFTKAQAHGAAVPFFYPPPFLLFIAWAALFSRDGGAIAMLVLNEVLQQ
jgi:hypothetical protein